MKSRPPPLEDSVSPGEAGRERAGWQPARWAPGAAAGCGGRAATTITLPLSPSQVQHICKWCQLICWLADGELRLPFIAQRRLRLLSLALTFLLLEQMQRLPEFGCVSARTEALRRFSASLCNTALYVLFKPFFSHFPT